jgi:hypothetical protein
MKNGDLSNEMPRRVLVNLDLIVTRKPRVERKFKLIPVVKEDVSYDRLFLNKLYMYTTRSEVTLELIAFDMTDDDLLVIYNELDNMGTNPFRYHTAYKSLKTLVADLPYRPEVIGVMDNQENRLMYGHWGLDF